MVLVSATNASESATSLHPVVTITTSSLGDESVISETSALEVLVATVTSASATKAPISVVSASYRIIVEFVDSIVLSSFGVSFEVATTDLLSVISLEIIPVSFALGEVISNAAEERRFLILEHICQFLVQNIVLLIRSSLIVCVLANFIL